jgi:hypothetical protein
MTMSIDTDIKRKKARIDELVKVAEGIEAEIRLHVERANACIGHYNAALEEIGTEASTIRHLLLEHRAGQPDEWSESEESRAHHRSAVAWIEVGAGYADRLTFEPYDLTEVKRALRAPEDDDDDGSAYTV